MRAAIYVNGSVPEISRQTPLLVRFCERHSITLEDDYSDFDGDTGSLRMMVTEAMLYGHFDTVVMESPEVIPETERTSILSELTCAGVSVASTGRNAFSGDDQMTDSND